MPDRVTERREWHIGRLARRADEQLRAARQQHVLDEHVLGAAHRGVAGYTHNVTRIEHACHDAAAALVADGGTFETSDDLSPARVRRCALDQDLRISPEHGSCFAFELDDLRTVVLDRRMVWISRLCR